MELLRFTSFATFDTPAPAHRARLYSRGTYPWRRTLFVACVVMLELALVAVAASDTRTDQRSDSAGPAPVIATSTGSY